MDKPIERLKEGDDIKRPCRLRDYIGQNDIKELISINISSAKKRDSILDHILLYGPPGLGKTTLATIIANEMDSNIKIVNGTSLERVRDIILVLADLEESDTLFIDEIHRVPKKIEEAIYSALEDRKIYITVEDKIIELDLPHFTLIGATTRVGMLSKPFRDRFTHIYRLQYYNIDELSTIIQNISEKMNIDINIEICREIAKRSRGTPRIAINLTKKVRDFYLYDSREIDSKFLEYIFKKLKIDKRGLDEIDNRYLDILKREGKPVSLKTISSLLNEDITTIEEYIEPYLIENGFIKKTSSGRVYNI